MLQYYILRRVRLIICLTRYNLATIGSRNCFPRSPLEPAEKHHVHVHTQQWRYIHRRWLRCSQMISVHVSCLHSRSSDWFVPFPSSVLLHSLKFQHFWRLCGSNGCSIDENEHFAAPQRFNYKWEWQHICVDVPDSNASLTSRCRLIYVNLDMRVCKNRHNYLRYVGKKQLIFTLA